MSSSPADIEKFGWMLVKLLLLASFVGSLAALVLFDLVKSIPQRWTLRGFLNARRRASLICVTRHKK